MQKQQRDSKAAVAVAPQPPTPPVSMSTMLTPKAVIQMYWSGMIVGIANAALFHPVDALRIRFFFQKKNLGSSLTFLNGLGFNVVSTAIKQMATFPTQEVQVR